VLYGAADEAKLRWLRGPGEPGSDSAPQVAALCEFLRHCDGATDHRAVAAVLDRLRTLGAGASGAGETLSDLLGHRSSLYRDRDKIQVVRLRSYILVTLSDIGVPRSSEPLLADAIEHFDERLMAVEIGSAARAVGMLGHAGRRFILSLVGMLSEYLSEQEFTLVRYEQEFTRSEATTIQLEAIRALGMICTERDVTAVEALRAFAVADRLSQRDPRTVDVAGAALRAIQQRASLDELSRIDP